MSTVKLQSTSEHLKLELNKKNIGNKKITPRMNFGYLKYISSIGKEQINKDIFNEDDDSTMLFKVS